MNRNSVVLDEDDDEVKNKLTFPVDAEGATKEKFLPGVEKDGLKSPTVATPTAAESWEVSTPYAKKKQVGGMDLYIP